MKEVVTSPFPRWLSSLFEDAFEMGPEHHDLLEGILGLSKVYLEEGNLETMRLARDIRGTINLYKENPSLTSEKDSTQLRRMIESGIYPLEICEHIQKLMDRSQLH